MKIKSYKLSATIPTGQYANIQPSIEIEGGDLKEAEDLAMTHVRELFNKYSDQSLKEKDISQIVELSSFNEDVVIDFDRVGHKYTYGGEPLTSATRYVAKFTKKFDAEGVSKNCEKSWGVPAEEISNMWSSNGSLASNFGKVIHEALEHYFNHKINGATIKESRDAEENYALPKHPLLKSIIEGFEKIDKVKGEVVQEILVTDIKNKRCGQIDRLLILDKKKKICRVQDYKVNVSAEEESPNNKLTGEWKDLSPTKLSKYQLQMSFYADLLEKSGWTIDGLDVFVFEDEWKHYEFDKLDIKVD